MLDIYKNLFEELNGENIKYCVYKGLSHLEEDLNGNRGDIDILLDENDIIKFNTIARNNNFFKVEKKDKPFYYMGIDNATHRFVMIDVDTEIRCGEKPYKPYSFILNMSELLIVKEFDTVKVLNSIDYVPLMFIIKIVSLCEKKEDLKELQDLIKTNEIVNSYLTSILKEKFSLDWSNISSDILNAENWIGLSKKYFLEIVQKIEKGNTLSFKQNFKLLLGKIKALQRKLKLPPYRIRNKGCLVAFVGVDGAGKSSTVDYIRELDFFKITGIKRIYFGSNEYWIPGLLKMILKGYKNRYMNIFISSLVSIDKQLRILRALYYMRLGNIVLADRYFYDNEIGKEMNKTQPKKKSIVRNIYRFLFEIRMLKKPELTIFLDVSPEVAYSRKQDYSFDKMLEVNKAYKEYMYKVDGVQIVNADNQQSEVYSEVVNAILRLEKDL